MNEDRKLLAAGVRMALARIPGSVNDVAARLGCSPGSLYRWKTGATAISGQHLARLARYSGLTQEQIRRADLSA